MQLANQHPAAFIYADFAEASAAAEDSKPVFGVRISGLNFLIPANRVCELLDKTQVNALPNVHPWISGIVNLRGQLVPVFDLQAALKINNDIKKRRLLAIDKEEKAIAIWIDNFPEIKDLLTMTPAKNLPTLPDVLETWVIGGYEDDNQLWLEIKFEDLFKTLGRHHYAAEQVAI